jgi:hypothetical protein
MKSILILASVFIGSANVGRPVYELTLRGLGTADIDVRFT